MPKVQVRAFTQDANGRSTGKSVTVRGTVAGVLKAVTAKFEQIERKKAE